MESSAPLPRPKPYRPKLATVDLFQPDKVAVMNLPRTVSKTHLVQYFANFGDVVDAIIRHRPDTTFGFVRFADPTAVEVTLAMEPHMVRGQPVRVLRAFRPREDDLAAALDLPVDLPLDPDPPLDLDLPLDPPLDLPLAPFPGMTPDRPHPAAPPSSPVSSVWDQDRSLWQGPLFEAVAAIWSTA